MVYVKPSSRSPEEVGRRLEQAAQKQKFGVLAVHNLKETMRNKGVDLAMECLIYEVCNPHQAKKVLEANGAVSTALPCRISVYREAGQTRVATILPTELLKAFRVPEMEPVAREVERAIVEMVNEAAA